jgi:hypothetical protein
MQPYIVEVSPGNYVNLALATGIDTRTKMAKVSYVGSATAVPYTEEESDVLRKALGRMKHEP